MDYYKKAMTEIERRASEQRAEWDRLDKLYRDKEDAINAAVARVMGAMAEKGITPSP